MARDNDIGARDNETGRSQNIDDQVDAFLFSNPADITQQ